MEKNLEEQISALVDGEVTDHELTPLLTHLRANSDLRERWHRYHLIRDTLHQRLPAGAGHVLHSRVWEAIQGEPPIKVRRRRWPPLHPWAKQALGFVIGAVVTAMAIFGFQAMDTAPVAGQSATTVATMPGASLGAAQPLVSGEVEGADAALSPYLINHNEHAISAGMHGMLPYVRLVSHGAAE